MVVLVYDDRDYEFVKKFDLLIIEVIEGGNVEEVVYIGEGKYINFGEFDGLENEVVIIKVI